MLHQGAVCQMHDHGICVDLLGPDDPFRHDDPNFQTLMMKLTRETDADICRLFSSTRPLCWLINSIPSDHFNHLQSVCYLPSICPPCFSSDHFIHINSIYSIFSFVCIRRFASCRYSLLPAGHGQATPMPHSRKGRNIHTADSSDMWTPSGAQLEILRSLRTKTWWDCWDLTNIQNDINPYKSKQPQNTNERSKESWKLTKVQENSGSRIPSIFFQHTHTGSVHFSPFQSYPSQALTDGEAQGRLQAPRKAHPPRFSCESSSNVAKVIEKGWGHDCHREFHSIEERWKTNKYQWE